MPPLWEPDSPRDSSLPPDQYHACVWIFRPARQAALSALKRESQCRTAKALTWLMIFCPFNFKR
jgi:hypothetical protein